MTIREITPDDLQGLLELYTHLHETGIPEDGEHLRETWSAICANPDYHIVVCEVDGKIISSCVCVILPNLTRGVRPYALVENVVTHADHRGKGYASACLDYARKLAEKSNCYKIMLITGSLLESTLQFYRNAGFSSEGKTAFYQWLW
mgnify:CR=1 FL=1|jgi:Sortase and related acyltransferases